jgi:hypothetical protein
MRYSSRSTGYGYRLGRRRRSRFPHLAILLTLGLGAFAGFAAWNQADETGRRAAPAMPAPQAGLAQSQPRHADPRLGPNAIPGYVPLTLAESAPIAAELRRIEPEAAMQTASLAPAIPLSRPTALATLEASAVAAPAALVQNAPIPLRRPTDLALPGAAEPPRAAGRAVTRQPKTAAVPAVPVDNRSFLEKLFGVPAPSSTGARLAYAAPQGDLNERSRGSGLTVAPAAAPVEPSVTTAAKTAIYDIAARTVYLPNGERLEAHSGLGDKMDDIRFAHVRMNGVTPPHVYDLTEREALFHGVRAIRLHPVGGSGKIFGRAGLLAHTYLLGPRGDSNGCVSIKDYDRFLQAFLRGEIKRLVVVAGRG